MLTVDLANPDFIEKEHITLKKNLLHVSRTMFVAGEALHQRLVVHNYGADAVSLLISVTFASDFADLFEVRGLARARRGLGFDEMSEGRVTLNYEGLDHVVRRTEIHFEPTPTALTEASASFRLSLKPQASTQSTCRHAATTLRRRGHHFSGSCGAHIAR